MRSKLQRRDHRKSTIRNSHIQVLCKTSKSKIPTESFIRNDISSQFGTRTDTWPHLPGESALLYSVGMGITGILRLPSSPLCAACWICSLVGNAMNGLIRGGWELPAWTICSSCGATGPVPAPSTDCLDGFCFSSDELFSVPTDCDIQVTPEYAAAMETMKIEV